MLVHGEGEKMEFLHSKIEQEFGKHCCVWYLYIQVEVDINSFEQVVTKMPL